MRALRSPWTSAARTVAGVVAALLAAGVVVFLPLPFVVVGPGPATDVLGSETKPDGTRGERIVVTGAPTYPTSGALDFTTVRVVGGPGVTVTGVEVLAAWLHPDRDVLPRDAIFPPEATEQQVAEENRLEMAGSQRTAAAVAVRAAGYPVVTVVTVARVPTEAPSAGVLREGDVLVSVGGDPVGDSAATRAALQRVPAGQEASLVVERAGALTPVRSPTGRAPDGRTVLGVTLRVEHRLPFEVRIDAGDVVGPSAGLMFALGVYDKLTPGALTGGRSIAGTGTIDDTAGVGPIDGVRQKMVGAREDGAEYFLVPGRNCPDVVDPPEPLSVVRVDTFDDARRALESIARGTTSLPRC